jgi:hypothetical protein
MADSAISHLLRMMAVDLKESGGAMSYLTTTVTTD